MERKVSCGTRSRGQRRLEERGDQDRIVGEGSQELEAERIIPGRKKMRTLFGWYERARRSKDGKKGRKRSVKSEAEEEKGSKTDVRILQPPKKKAKENTDDH